ncbi:MAG TPA: type II toxin-antitoxin system RelE/ParE family toxin [Solidesulfovibrio magneticus]|jgi:phage-related protein|nr:type II toxin-antitoxin system RelE/ParE family toxin [Solidesulfovibrio magneticus]
MTRTSPPTREKPIHWVGSAKKDFLEFPIPVQREMGYALGLAQIGGKHPRVKPWKGLGTGVFEMLSDDDGNTFRTVYAVRFASAVYVLHAFQKKSKTGIKTPQEDADLIASRLQSARDHHKRLYAN